MVQWVNVLEPKMQRWRTFRNPFPIMISINVDEKLGILKKSDFLTVACFACLYYVAEIINSKTSLRFFQ